jgi:SAM-dependent methyltransferase
MTREPACADDLLLAILSQASGVVLDVGPGTGTSSMPLLTSPAITAIYGIEPCAGLHAGLRTSAVEAGLAGKYTVLPCSVAAETLHPELEKCGLVLHGNGKGVFDTIICVRVLCSVPDIEKTVCEVYDLLKPGENPSHC